MLVRRILLLLLAVVLSVGTAVLPHSEALAAGKTKLLLISQPGDYIGGGQRLEYGPADGSFSVANNFDGGARVSFNSLTPGVWWDLNFAAPGDRPLKLRLYDGATRFPFQSPAEPGLDVSGTGRGCNTLTGRFLVLEIVRDSANTITSLAVDFEQHCEGGNAALFGAIRYKSEVEIKPRISIGDVAVRKGNDGSREAVVIASLSLPSERPASAWYSTLDGTAAWSIDYRASSGRFVILPEQTEYPLKVEIFGNRKARGDREFQVKLRHDNTVLGDGVSQVSIIDPNVPITAVLFNSESGDYIGGGAHRVWTKQESSIAVTGNNPFNMQLDGPGGMTITMASGTGGQLLPGIYKNAQRYPFQPPGVPGLSISGEGRGCNTLTGQFAVKEAVYGTGGKLETFAASFEQHCEGGDPALFGTVRLNALLTQASITDARVVGNRATFTVTLNPPSLRNETLHFTTVDGTANGSTDYIPLSADVIFSPGVVKQTVVVSWREMARSGTEFSARISSRRTPVWIEEGHARFE